MAQSSWLMLQGSWLKARGSWPGQIWRWVTQAPGPSAKVVLDMSHEPWATSLEACATSLEPWAIDNRLINWLINYQSINSPILPNDITPTFRVHLIMLNDISGIFRQMFSCKCGQIMSNNTRRLVIIFMFLWQCFDCNQVYSSGLIVELILIKELYPPIINLRVPLWVGKY